MALKGMVCRWIKLLRFWLTFVESFGTVRGFVCEGLC